MKILSRKDVTYLVLNVIKYLIIDLIKLIQLDGKVVGSAFHGYTRGVKGCKL